MILGKCNGLCTPTILYICLTLFSILMRLISKKSDTKVIMSQLLVSSLWTAVLYILCSHCHEKWAWTLLVLPIILGLILMMLVAEYIVVQDRKKNKEHFKQDNDEEEEHNTQQENNAPVHQVDNNHNENSHVEDEKDPQPHETKYVQNLDMIN